MTRVLGALLLTVSVGRACWPAPQEMAAASNLESWKTPALYEYGSTLLKRGRLFDRATAALRIVVAREPAKPEYQIALGSAYASRFASVVLASRQRQRYAAEQAVYASRKEEWIKAQEEPTNPRFGRPPPEPPAVPATPDDGAAFILSQNDARQEMRRLGRLAARAFELAHRATEGGSSEERVRADYAQGWGLFLLRRFGKDVVRDKPSPPRPSCASEEELVVTEEQVAACFRRCTEVDPDNPDHWYSLALAIVPRYVSFDEDGYIAYVEGRALYPEDTIKLAAAALRRALERKPADFDVLHLMALLYAPGAPKDSELYQAKAAHRMAYNAVVWYELAERRFRMADRAQPADASSMRDLALSAIEKGNKAARYFAVPLATPAPSLLRRAWQAAAVYGIGDEALVILIFTSLRELIRGERALDAEIALRAASAEFGFGLKIMQAMGGDDLDLRNPRVRSTLRIRRSLGPTYCIDGYQAIEKSHRDHPDPRKARFLQENADLIRHVRELIKAMDI